MSTVPLASGGEDKVVPEGPDDVRGISDFAQRLVRSAFFQHPRLHRALGVVLAVLAGICVVATVARLSPLPLLPLPVFAVGGYSLWRLHGASKDYRAQLTWICVYTVAILVGFWLMSVVARILD